MNTHNIELPPLPDLPAYSSEVFDREVKVVSETMAEQLMHDYARAAIVADRQRRGEPVAYIRVIPYDDDGNFQRDIIEADKVGDLSIYADFVTFVPLYTTPQPNENTDPVKSQTETWVVGTEDNRTVYIQSSDFKYDTRLYVNGDFINKDEKIMYANELAKRLNDPTR